MRLGYLCERSQNAVQVFLPAVTAFSTAVCCHRNRLHPQAVLKQHLYKYHHGNRRKSSITMVTRSSSGSYSPDSGGDDISIKSEDYPAGFFQWSPPKEPPKFNMSFAGCGFLGIYHLGVAKALMENGQQFLRHVERFGGASAGSLVAGILAIKGESTETVDLCIEWCLNSAKLINKKPLGLLTPRFDLLASLENFLDSLLPENAHEIANEKLFVSLTTLEGKKNIILTQFDSKEDVLRALLGSSYVPLITGTKPVKLHGKKYIDGGLTDNLPEVPGVKDVRTIFVSPFSGGYHISPCDKRGKNWVTRINGQNFQVNIDNLIRGYHAFNPPKPDLLDKYYKRGVQDTLRFLQKENFYSPSALTSPTSGIGSSVSRPANLTNNASATSSQNSPSSTDDLDLPADSTNDLDLPADLSDDLEPNNNPRTKKDRKTDANKTEDKNMKNCDKISAESPWSKCDGERSGSSASQSDVALYESSL